MLLPRSTRGMRDRQTGVLQADFDAWRNWMLGATDTHTKESWYAIRAAPLSLSALLRGAGSRQAGRPMPRRPPAAGASCCSQLGPSNCRNRRGRLRLLLSCSNRVACRIVYHKGQLEKARNVGGRQTDHGWNRLGGILMQLFNVVLLVALVDNVISPDYETVMRQGQPVQQEVSGSVSRKARTTLVLVVHLQAGAPRMLQRPSFA